MSKFKPSHPPASLYEFEPVGYFISGLTALTVTFYCRRLSASRRRSPHATLLLCLLSVAMVTTFYFRGNAPIASLMWSAFFMRASICAHQELDSNGFPLFFLFVSLVRTSSVVGKNINFISLHRNLWFGVPSHYWCNRKVLLWRHLVVSLSHGTMVTPACAWFGIHIVL